MSVPTLARSWSAMLTLAGLSLILTLVTDVGAKKCGGNSQCRYGTRCDAKASRCVCLSDNGQLKNRTGHPDTVFYCLSEGVTECGGTLCGYRAVCDTNRGQCQCSSNNDVLKEIKDISPSLWYCLESCAFSNRSCPMNTTCTEIDIGHRSCTCSSAATLSSTGQCLGVPATAAMSPTAQFTTKRVSPPQDSSGKPTASFGSVTTTTGDPSLDGNVQPAASHCNALTLGLVVGFGEALCLVVIFVVVVLIRKHRRMKAGETYESQDSVLRNTNSNGNVSSAETEISYENIVSPLSFEEYRTRRQTDLRQPTVLVNSPGYETVRAPPQSLTDNDTSGLYESANVAESPGDRLYTTLRQT